MEKKICTKIAGELIEIIADYTIEDVPMDKFWCEIRSGFKSEISKNTYIKN